MIFGIGTDIVAVSRLRDMWQRHGEHALARLLAADEYSDFAAAADKGRFLAKRFAAKEAIAKALGTGIAEGVNLNDIEIANDERGKPYVRLHGGAAARMQAMGANHCHLSISDERDHALAFAVLSL